MSIVQPIVRSIAQPIVSGITGVGSASAATRAFLALAANDDGEWLPVVEGVENGGAYSTSTSSRFYPDHEGVYREALSGEIGCVGGRVVRNHVVSSEDFAGTGWSTDNSGSSDPVINTTSETAPDGSSSASSVTFGAIDSAGDYSRLRISTLPTYACARTLYIKAATASDVGKKFFLYGNSTANATVYSLTDTWQRIHQQDLTGFRYTIGTLGSTYGGENQDAVTVHLLGAQFEVIHGQTNQNPGEYVPTTDSSAVKYLDYANATTVVDNVVYPAKGATFIDKPRARVVGYDLTNSALYSNDATTQPPEPMRPAYRPLQRLQANTQGVSTSSVRQAQER